MRDRVVAIIPARGGSKGVPGKNIKPLAGKPLLAHVIEAARKASFVDEVCVSTDDEKIAEVARAYGAQVIDRPAELATDTATSEAALTHALRHLQEQGKQYTICVFLQATSPLTRSSDVDRLISEVVNGTDSAAFYVPEYANYFGIDDLLRERLPRQEKKPKKRETGNAWAFRINGFMEHGSRLFGTVGLVEISPPCHLEIDTLFEFQLIEYILTHNLWKK